MRWFNFFILAYVMLGVQIGLNPYARLGSALPNFVLLTAVFIAINAPRDSALIACFVLGLMQDMLTVSPLGLYAMEYSVLAMFVSSAQDLVYGDHFLTHMSLGFVGSLLTSFITVLHGLIYPIFHGYKTPHASLGVLFLSALYTGLIAPVVLWVLGRLRRLFGFRPARMHGNRRS